MKCCSGDCRQGRDCPARREDDSADFHIGAFAALLAVIAVGMVMERLGIPISWPF